jgi:lambda repressor-like predicted transcriptional regulator
MTMATKQNEITPENLRAMLAKHGMTQAQLSEKLGLHFNTVPVWLARGHVPRRWWTSIRWVMAGKKVPV